jgi:hypothetical protein
MITCVECTTYRNAFKPGPIECHGDGHPEQCFALSPVEPEEPEPLIPSRISALAKFQKTIKRGEAERENRRRQEEERISMKDFVNRLLAGMGRGR